MSLFLIIRAEGRSSSACMGLCARAGATMHTNSMCRAPPPPPPPPHNDANCGESVSRPAPPTLWRPLFVHSDYDGISKIPSHAPQSKRQKGGFQACRRCKVMGRRPETMEGRRDIFEGDLLKRQEDAAQHRIGCGYVLSQQLVTQTALSRVSGAQLFCRGSADRMARFRRRGSTDGVAAIRQTSCW